MTKQEKAEELQTLHVEQRELILIKEIPANELIEKIISAAADYYGLTIEQVKSRSRKGEIVSARMFAILIFLETSPLMTLERLGAILGGLDHSTVGHARNMATELTKTSKAAINAYICIKEKAGV